MGRSTVVKIAEALTIITATGLVVLGLSIAQTDGPGTPVGSAVATSTTATPTPTVDPNNPWD